MDNDFLQSIKDKKLQAQKSQLADSRQNQLVEGSDNVKQAILNMAQAIIEANLQHKPDVTVQNMPESLATSDDIRALREAIEKSQQNTHKENKKGTQGLESVLTAILDQLEKLYDKDNQSDVTTALNSIEEELKDKDVTVSNLDDLGDFFFSLEEAVKSLKLDPTIDVKPADVNVEAPVIDLSPLNELKKAIESLDLSVNVDVDALREDIQTLIRVTNDKPVPSPPRYKTNAANQLQVESTNQPRTGFGELNTAENVAYIQAAPVYNLTPANFREFTSGSGTAGTSNRMFTVTTGTSVGGYGAIQSFRAINYKAGQAGLARFTAIFEDNAADSWQGVGLISIGDELSFGYNGTTFGIWHRKDGVAENRTITVTGASGGSTDLTLTLNSVAYTIPLTAGTVQHNAYEIAQWLNDNQSVWSADQVDDTVIIAALSDGAKSGTYSFSHATATGSIAQNEAGVTKTSTHIPQNTWNQDKRESLDPSKGNVYQIQYQYLGFGDIVFSIENPETGVFEPVHIIQYANANTTPSIGNPSLRLGLYCVSIGSTTDLTVRSASMAAFVQGRVDKTRNPRADKNTQLVSTTMTNVLAIRNRRSYNGFFNQVEVEPLRVSISSESSKNVEVEIRATGNPGVEQNYQQTGTNLVVDKDTTAFTGYSGGRLLAAFTLSGGDSQTLDLRELSISLPPSLHLIVQARVTSGATANVTAALTWYEDL